MFGVSLQTMTEVAKRVVPDMNGDGRLKGEEGGEWKG